MTTDRGISPRILGNIFSSYIRNCWLYGCKTWLASSKTIRFLTFADNDMICWVCGVQLEQHIRTQELHKKLVIISVPKNNQKCHDKGLDTYATSTEWIQMFGQEE